MMPEELEQEDLDLLEERGAFTSRSLGLLRGRVWEAEGVGEEIEGRRDSPEFLGEGGAEREWVEERRVETLL